MIKLCECGCGREVKYRFAWGHNNPRIGQHQTTESKLKISLAMKSVNVQNKSKQTNLIKRGVEYTGQSKNAKEKVKQTCLKKYGVEHSMKAKEVQDKSKQTCLKKYGVDNFSKTFEFRQLAREQMINSIKLGLKDGKSFKARKGNNEISFINELQQYTNYFIDNDSEIISYLPDGYIKELNLVIEFDEPWHNRTFSVIRDNQKNKDYEKIGLTIFRVQEKEWLVNKQSIINQFKILVENLNGNN